MVEVYQNGQRLLNDVVGTFALHLANEADATGIMLELGVVETLFFGKSGILHFWCMEKGVERSSRWARATRGC